MTRLLSDDTDTNVGNIKIYVWGCNAQSGLVNRRSGGNLATLRVRAISSSFYDYNGVHLERNSFLKPVSFLRNGDSYPLLAVL